MPCKKARTKKIHCKDEVFQDIKEFKSQMIDDIRQKREVTDGCVIEKRNGASRRYSASFRSDFSEDITNFNLYAFLAMNDDEDERTMNENSEPSAQTSLVNIQVKEEFTVSDNARIRESVPANNQLIPKYEETIQRPPGVGRVGRVTIMSTPMGPIPYKAPRMITPKVQSDCMVARMLQPNEIGFSVRGSPLVGSGTNALFEELLNKPEDDMSPCTKNFTANVKQYIRSKFNG